jgi:chromosome segregation ATPase
MKPKNAISISIILIGLVALSCQKQTDYQPQIDALQSSANALIKRCDSLTNVLAQSNKTILNLSTAILDLTIKQGNTNSSIDSIKTRIARILTSVTSLNDQLSKVYSKIDSLNIQLTQTNANITAIHAELALLNTQITQLTTQYTSLLAQLNQIRSF